MAASKTALVDQVKNLQRTNPDAKQAWWDYCDQHLGGVRDPAKHEASTLAQFVTAHSSGVLPKPAAAAATPKVARPVRPAMAVKPAFPAYAAMPPAAAAWAANPAAAAAFAAALGGFPGLGVAAAHNPAARLQDMVKTGQRHSQHWRTAWQTYCALYGTGFNDPAKYEDSFVTGFMDYIGQLATADLNNIATENGITVELDAKPGSKRPLASAAPAAAMAAPAAKRPRLSGATGAPSSDAEKAALVEKVKVLQRSSTEAKEAWWAYCDEHLKGIKDPGRHDITILQQFVETYS